MSDSKFGAGVVDRMRAVLGLDSDMQLAKSLGRAGSSVSNWRVRGNVPVDECIRFAAAHDISLDWLILGKTSAPITASTSPQPIDSGMSTDPMADYTPVDMYDIEAAAGSGSFFEHENVEATLYFDTAQLEAEGLRPDRLIGAKVRGDSMNDTLRSGDRVIVDRSHRTPDGVFLLRICDELRIKRVQRVAGGALMLISDNPVYEREMIRPEEMGNVEIIGRCCLRIGSID